MSSFLPALPIRGTLLVPSCLTPVRGFQGPYDKAAYPCKQSGLVHSADPRRWEDVGASCRLRDDGLSAISIRSLLNDVLDLCDRFSGQAAAK